MNKIKNFKDIKIDKTYRLTLMRTKDKSWNSVKVLKIGESRLYKGVLFIKLQNTKTTEIKTLFSKFYNRGWFLEDI